MPAPARRPHKAVNPVLHDALTPAAALRRIAAACLQQLEANTPGALASSDPEFVHQMRVALRRLRCALRFFDDPSARHARKRFGPALRALGRALGEQRNWDVFITATLPQLGLAAPVRARALRLRAAARARARELLGTPGHVELLHGMAAWVAAAPPDRAAGRKPGVALHDTLRPHLKGLHRRVKRGARHFGDLDEEARHRVRIDVKRLRYAVDAVGSLYEPLAVGRYTEALGDLQDLLGDLTDINTARLLLGKLVVGKVGLGLALRRLDQRESALLAQALGRFAGVMAAAGFWKHSKRGEHHV